MLSKSFILLFLSVWSVSKKSTFKSLSTMVDLSIYYYNSDNYFFMQLKAVLVVMFVHDYYIFLEYCSTSRTNHFSSLFLLFTLNSTLSNTETMSLTWLWVFFPGMPVLSRCFQPCSVLLCDSLKTTYCWIFFVTPSKSPHVLIREINLLIM